MSTIKNRAELQECIQDRAKKINKGRLSAPDSEGILAIICASIGGADIAHDVAHVETLVERAEKNGRDPNSILPLINPEYTDVRDALADRAVSSVVMLGHGNIGRMKLNWDLDGLAVYQNWFDSRMIDHVKTGSFQQRTCGKYDGRRAELRMPLGTFIMLDQRQVFAVQNFAPEDDSGVEVFDAKIGPVFELADNTATGLLLATEQLDIWTP